MHTDDGPLKLLLQILQHGLSFLCRVYSFVPLDTWRQMSQRVQTRGKRHPKSRLFWGGMKEFADGSFGSRTALMSQPYKDDPSTNGTRTIPLDELYDHIQGADASDLQVAVHAIGDQSIDEVLGLFAKLKQHKQSAWGTAGHSSSSRNCSSGVSISGQTAGCPSQATSNAYSQDDNTMAAASVSSIAFAGAVAVAAAPLSSIAVGDSLEYVAQQAAALRLLEKNMSTSDQHFATSDSELELPSAAVSPVAAADHGCMTTGCVQHQQCHCPGTTMTPSLVYRCLMASLQGDSPIAYDNSSHKQNSTPSSGPHASAALSGSSMAAPAATDDTDIVLPTAISTSSMSDIMQPTAISGPTDTDSLLVWPASAPATTHSLSSSIISEFTISAGAISAPVSDPAPPGPDLYISTVQPGQHTAPQEFASVANSQSTPSSDVKKCRSCPPNTSLYTATTPSVIVPKHRIEHAQHLSHPEAAAKFAEHGVFAIANPLHLLTDGPMLESRLGSAQAAPGFAFAFNTLLKQGAPVAFASDWPVVELDALGSCYAAAFRHWPKEAVSHLEAARSADDVTHAVNQNSSTTPSLDGCSQPCSSSNHDIQTPAAQHTGSVGAVPSSSTHELPSATPHVWHPSERVSMEQALLGHTAWAADSGLLGDVVGRLRKGLKADFVVLDTSPLLLTEQQRLPKVLWTYVDGRCAFGC